MTATYVVSIEIDEARLGGYTDSYLATAWHVAQVNLAPHDDRDAGELVEHIGREIIRRWLREVPPELWHHQGRSYYWSQLTRFARYQPGAGDVRDPQWRNGTWVAKDTANAEPSAEDSGGVAGVIAADLEEIAAEAGRLVGEPGALEHLQGRLRSLVADLRKVGGA